MPRMAGVQADGWWALGVEGEPGEVESTGAEWAGPAQGTQLSIMPGGRDLIPSCLCGCGGEDGAPAPTQDTPGSWSVCVVVLKPENKSFLMWHLG